MITIKVNEEHWEEIDERIWNERDSVEYTWIGALPVVVFEAGGSSRIRVRIRRNAYDFQSWAIAELWDDTKWNQVVTLPFTSALSCHAVSYRDGATGAARLAPIIPFQVDRDRLLELVRRIVR